MATLAAETIVRTGLGATYTACAGGGDDFINTGDEFINLKNGSGAPITLTIVTPKIVDDYLAVEDRDVVVPAGGERLIGPFPTGIYNNSTTGKVSLTYSGVTSLTLAVLKPGV